MSKMRKLMMGFPSFSERYVHRYPSNPNSNVGYLLTSSGQTLNDIIESIIHNLSQRFHSDLEAACRAGQSEASSKALTTIDEFSGRRIHWCTLRARTYLIPSSIPHEPTDPYLSYTKRWQIQSPRY